MSDAEKKQKSLVEYRRRLLEKKELQAKVKSRMRSWLSMWQIA